MCNTFSVLTEEAAAPNRNRLRDAEQADAFERARFTAVKVECTRATVPAERRETFLPKWRDMAAEDQDSTAMSITLRKPA